MKMKIYYAVSKRGQGRIFTSLPERDEHFGIWVGDSVGCVSQLVWMMESDGMGMPMLKWADEPVEMEIEVKFSEG